MGEPPTGAQGTAASRRRGGGPGSAAGATLGVAVAATLLGGLPVWLVAGLAPQLRRDLDLDAARLGSLIGLNFAVMAVAAVPAGRLVERIGWRRGLAVTAAFAATSLAGIALTAHTWPVLVALLCLGALGASLSHPAANLGIAQQVPRARQGVAFGVKQASIPLTTLVAGLASPLVAETVGWRWAFGAAAMVSLLLLVAISIEPGPLRHLWAQGPSATPATSDAGRPAATVNESLSSLVILAVGAGLVAAATISLGSFLVLSAVESGVAPDTAGVLLALGSGVGILSRIMTGVLADRRGSRHLLVVVWMMLGGSAGLLVLAAADTLWVLVLGTLLAFGLGWSWNGLFAFVVVLRNPLSPAFATGVIQTALAGGGIVGPPVFGLLAEGWSYSAAWSGAALASTCGALLMIVGRRASRAARVDRPQPVP